MKRDKVILHYDMDCFYASVEIRDNPKLANKPLIVGETIVTTASYEARKFGIHSAMRVSDAKKLCPSIIIVPVNKNKYMQTARVVQKLVLKLTNKIEFIASDEGYIDISDIISSYKSKQFFVEKFMERIKFHTGITCSVGVGFNKLSAKIGSNINKPRGYHIFHSQLDFTEYIENKNIGILPGVGEKFLNLLNKKSIFFVKDVYSFPLTQLSKIYGRARGELLYFYSRGLDFRDVEHNRETHSIGNENTFKYPLDGELEIKRELDKLFDYAYNRLKKKMFLCKTVNIKLKFSFIETITRSKTLDSATDSKDRLKEIMYDILDIIQFKSSIKLLGISFGNLTKKASMQLRLFEI